MTPLIAPRRSPTDSPLGLIDPVETRVINGEVVVVVGPQRFAGERLAAELNSRLYLTEAASWVPR
jgi:hypothetical protein